MNGTAHTVIGATTGFISANILQTSPSATVMLVGLGIISGLFPDLDIDGKLSNKITFSHRVLKSTAQLIGVLLVVYSFFNGAQHDHYISLIAGTCIFAFSSLIKQKHMLLLTGIGVAVAATSLQEQWLFLLGIYILLASLVSHRSYTHSLIGLAFFSVIAFKLETAIGISGIFYTCLAGYVSHLLADSKFLPFNKRGVKLFLPLSAKEW